MQKALTQMNIQLTNVLSDVVGESGQKILRAVVAGERDSQVTSWLGLCPGTKITGGKVMSGKTKRVVNRAAQSLRLAAAALRSSNWALGAYFRRMCSRMDAAGMPIQAPHARSAWASYDHAVRQTSMPSRPAALLTSRCHDPRRGCRRRPRKCGASDRSGSR
jgi:hypothetical protein